MNTLDRWATNYGNFVANTKIPTFPYVRRIAKTSPRDYGVYAFWNVFLMGVFNGVRISRLKEQNKKLRRENERLTKLFETQQKVFTTQSLHDPTLKGTTP